MLSLARKERRVMRKQIEREYESRGESVPMVTEALCFSIHCDPDGRCGKLVKASKHSSFCAVCGHALFWRQRKITHMRRKRNLR